MLWRFPLCLGLAASPCQSEFRGLIDALFSVSLICSYAMLYVHSYVQHNYFFPYAYSQRHMHSHYTPFIHFGHASTCSEMHKHECKHTHEVMPKHTHTLSHTIALHTVLSTETHSSFMPQWFYCLSLETVPQVVCSGRGNKAASFSFHFNQGV